MPCAPSRFQITVIHVDRPAMIAIDRRPCASAAKRTAAGMTLTFASAPSARTTPAAIDAERAPAFARR